jgi:BolA protein
MSQLSRSERIRQSLQDALNPVKLDLFDDSDKHAWHAEAKPGGQTHYTLVIESEKFRGMSMVQSHQLIYGLLDEEFKTGLHALAIKASAPK